MATEYAEAPEVAAIVARIVEEVPEHGWIAGRRIAGVFRIAKHAAESWVKPQVLTGVHQLLSRYEAVLVVDKRAWDYLPPEGRVALIDHGLSYFGIDDDGRICLVKPPVTEFPAVIARRGLWNRHLEAIASAIALGPRPQSLLPDDTHPTITDDEGRTVDTTTGEVRRVADALTSR